MDTIQDAVQTLRALVSTPASSTEKIIEASQDFWEAEHDDEQEQVEHAFRAKHHAVVQKLIQAWGAPVFEGNWESNDFPEWAASESVCFAYWQFGSRAAYVAVQHHDRELPFLLVIGTCKL